MNHLKNALQPAVLVGFFSGLVNAIVFLALFPHLFPGVSHFARWALQVVAWYVLLVSLASLALALVLGLFDRRQRTPAALDRLYWIASLGGVVFVWLGKWVNFGLLPRPVRIDALYLAANALLALIVGFLVLLLYYLWPRRALRGPTLSLGLLLAVAATVVGLAISQLAPQKPSPPPLEQSVYRFDDPSGAAGSAAPNVFLLTVDTLRADHLGHYGYVRDTSPILDQLAAESVVIESAFCQKGSTPVSFASIMTALYPRRHGLHNTGELLAEEHLTLAEVLRAVGYDTAAVISNGQVSSLFNFDQGFRHYILEPEPATADHITDRSLQLAKTELREPFFFWVHYSDPHDPYSPPPPYDRTFVADQHYLHRPVPLPLPPTLARSTPGFAGHRDDPTQTVAWHLAQYDGEIRFMDEEIGRLIDYFVETGVLDRTLLVFTADHGENFGEHGEWGHGTTTDDANARIPLFFRMKGRLPAGTHVQAITESVDIAPTILELLGLPIPGEMQGRSRVAWLADPATGTDEGSSAIIEGGWGNHIGRGIQQALRTLDWHYVWRDTRWLHTIEDPSKIFWIWNSALEGGLGPNELYDLRANPEENLIARLPARAAELDAKLHASLEAQGPEMPEAPYISRAEVRRLDPKVEESLRALGYID